MTVLNQTPSAFRQLIRADEEKGEDRSRLALRWVIFGGEALDLAALSPWIERHGDESPKLINMYGITETTVHVTWRRIVAADLARPGSSPVGAPIPDLRVHLLGRHLELLPAGVPGEIHVGGAGLARGYLGRPALTAGRFIPDPFSLVPGARLYRSGDLARRRPDGDVEYLGRIDGQVKIRGFRIEPGEIEASLNRHPGHGRLPQPGGCHRGPARPAADRHRPGGGRSGGQSGGGGIGSGPADRRLQEVTELLDRLLASGQEEVVVPARDLRALRRFAQSAQGSREASPRPTGARHPRPALTTPFVELGSELELQVAGLWQDLLGIDGLGAGDNFFELGGHSLLATQLMSQVRDRFGVEVRFARFFDAPTVAGLASVIVELQTAGLEEAGLAELLAEIQGLSAEELRDGLAAEGGLFYGSAPQPKIT